MCVGIEPGRGKGRGKGKGKLKGKSRSKAEPETVAAPASARPSNAVGNTDEGHIKTLPEL
eukprot:5710886-Amphidinium_carterae.1